MDEGRIKDEKVAIQDSDVKEFFKRRAEHYLQRNDEENTSGRYCVTMYQDDNPELVLERDNYEKKIIGSILDLNDSTSILDIGCGVGRWADYFLDKKISEYVGIDYSKEMIEIARSAFSDTQYNFYVGDFQSATDILKENGCPTKYDYIFVNGVFLYINDDDLNACFEQLRRLCKSGSRIYIKDSIGVDSRLTLKNFNSKELKTEYNAIYRSMEEWNSLLENNFPKNEYCVVSSGYVYAQSMKNRSETTNYYWVVKKI